MLLAFLLDLAVLLFQIVFMQMCILLYYWANKMMMMMMTMILALEVASRGNHQCANCIGTLSFPVGREEEMLLLLHRQMHNKTLKKKV